jgi:tetratricopeptide (TPR) repeat protein
MYCFVVLAALLLLLPGCQSRYMTSGKVYVQQNNWEKAREQFELEVQSNPSNGEAYVYLGQGYEKAGEYERAGESFTKAKEVTKDQKKRAEYQALQEQLAVDHIKFGNVAFENQDFERAAEEYQVASWLYPEYISAYKNWAIALLQAENYEGSKQGWQRVIELSEPGNDEWLQAHDLLAKLALEDSSYSVAMEHIDQMLQYKPDDLELLEIKAQCHDAMDDSEAALGLYQKIAEIDPQNVDAHFNMGVMLVKLERKDEAQEALQKAADIAPEDRDVLYNLGLLALEARQWDLAEQAFRRVVELDDQDAHAWQNLGICLLNLEKTQEGQDAFKKAEELGIGE